MQWREQEPPPPSGHATDFLWNSMHAWAKRIAAMDPSIAGIMLITPQVKNSHLPNTGVPTQAPR